MKYVPRLEKSEGRGTGYEAGVDSVEVTCEADGNPQPNVVWRKSGDGESLFSVGKHLRFNPVKRGDGGTYYCMARNRQFFFQLNFHILLFNDPRLFLENL